MLDPIYLVVGWILAFYYQFIPSLGVSIILLTCTVMLALAPLTAKQARSMIRMQQVQPEIKRLQAKHKDDRQTANEEIMKYYKEQKINPLSGCLPLLMQMPILFGLFRVLRGIQDGNHIPKTGRFNQLYLDLTATPPTKGATTFLGMNLFTSPMDSVGSFFDRAPYFIIVGLIIAAGVIQSRQTMARQQGAAVNPQMQMVGRIMPVFFGFISLNFEAGLNVYFLSSTLWRVGQQHLVVNKIHEQEKAKTEAKKKPAVEASSRDVPVIEPEPNGQTDKSVPPNRNTSRAKRKKRKR